MNQLPPENAAQQEPASGQKNDPSGKDGQQRPSADFAALIDAITTEVGAYRAEEKREDKGKTCREWITVFLLGATMIAIFWQVYEMVQVYGRIRDQADAATKQSEISDKASIQAQRAWVAPIGMELAQPLQVKNPFRVTASFENVGKEPAIDINISQQVKFSPAPSNIDFSSGVGFEKNDFCKGLNPIDCGNVMYPGASRYQKKKRGEVKWLRMKNQAKELTWTHLSLPS